MSNQDIPEMAMLASRSIMEALRQKDVETYKHCVRVARWARLLAQAAGLSEYESRIVEFSGLFHDIGKVGVPDNILLKPGRLDENEYRVMQAHPIKSVEMLQHLLHIHFFKELVPGVLHHHEWLNGSGYPYRLVGDQIPLSARIILIVDTFDAMTLPRSYRPAASIERAYKEIRDYSNRQFDPQLAKIFLQAHPLWLQGDIPENLEREMAQRFKGVSSIQHAAPTLDVSSTASASSASIPISATNSSSVLLPSGAKILSLPSIKNKSAA